MADSTASPRPAVQPGTRWDDYLEIFVKPAAVFRRREGSNPFLPLLVLVIGTIVLYFATRSAMQPVMDAEFARNAAQMAQRNPEVTAEQMEQGRGMMENFGGVVIAVSTFFIPLIVGVVLWLVGKGAGSVATLGNAVMVAVFAYFPRLLEWLASAVMALITPEGGIRSRYDVTLGLGRFLDPATTSPMALAFLGRIDLFTIWVTVLIAIGIKVVGRIGTVPAIVVAALVWLIGALPALMGGMASGAGG
jgi:hypothetical protein